MLYSIVGADDREYGPVDTGVLVQWAREGRVVERTTIVEHETGRRYLACDMAELAVVFRPTTTTIAPPRVGRTVPDTPPYAGVPGIPPLTTSPRSRIAAGLLGILLPGLGIHRFYLGYTGVGMVQLMMTVLFPLTCGASAIISVMWCFIEGILCLTGAFRDADGRPLSV